MNKELEVDITEENTKKEWYENKIIRLLLPFLALLLVGAVTKNYSNYFKDVPKIPPKAATDNFYTATPQPWNTYELENTDIKVELPKQPTKEVIPEELSEYIRVNYRAHNQFMLELDDLGIVLRESKPKKAYNVTFKNFIDAQIRVYKEADSDFKYELTFSSRNKAKLSGYSVTLAGKTNFLVCYIEVNTSQGSNFYTCLIVYDNSQWAEAKRVLNSFQIKNSDENCK